MPGALADLLAYRWWTRAEIAGAADEAEFTPPGIVEWLEPLLAGEVPAAPVVIER